MNLDEIEIEIMNIQLNSHYAERSHLEKKLNLYRNIKNQILVTFPLENLDLSKYVVGYNKKNYVYDLYGICNHSGGSYGGHYTSFVKLTNGKWYHFNDTIVQEVTDLNQLVSPKAYCFFYKIRGLESL